MIKTKKNFRLKISEVSRKFRVENNNLDISEILKYTDYEVFKVGDLCKPHKENRDKKLTNEKKFRYVEIGDIDVNLGTIKTYRSFFGKDAPNNAKRIMSKGDVLVSTRRPTRGAVVAVPEDFHGHICTVFFTTLKIFNWEKSDPRFLALYLRTSIAKQQFASQITETAYPVISDEDVLDIEVLLPRIDTQLKVINDYEKSLKNYFFMLDKAHKQIIDAQNNLEEKLLGDFGEKLAYKKFQLNAIDKNKENC
tara:strand:+ start:72 stop:824 length:753 start_codon:yes stop_codon:yes gene_type:complete